MFGASLSTGSYTYSWEMKIKLSIDEMLNQWRLRRALEPLRSDCTVERLDGIDLDVLLRNEINDWYRNLLDTAPVEMLVVTDISAMVALSKRGDGSATIRLPERCRRVVEVMLDCWEQPARIVEADTITAQMQENPYSRGGITAPVAVKRHGRLQVYSIPSNVDGKIASLQCVLEPEEGFYEMDERALSTIESYE